MNLYRVKIEFTDGIFTVDAWATMPEQAQHMALIDARMLHAGGCYSGKVLSADVQTVCDMRVGAHCVDAEFEETILKTYDVKITERDRAPWEWCFRGTRNSLENMWSEHWGGVPENLPKIKEVRK